MSQNFYHNYLNAKTFTKKEKAEVKRLTLSLFNKSSQEKVTGIKNIKSVRVKMAVSEMLNIFTI